MVGGLADDRIIRNANTGITFFWVMSQGSNGWQNFATIAPGWAFARFGDLDGNGRDDIIPQDQQGLAIAWTPACAAEIDTKKARKFPFNLNM